MAGENGSVVLSMDDVKFLPPQALMGLQSDGGGIQINVQSASNGLIACDPRLFTIRQNIEPWRYSTALATLQVSGTDLQLAANSNINWFINGRDEFGSGQGWPANYVMGVDNTDAFDKGAMVQEGYSYIAFAIAHNIERPFVFGAANEKTYPAWLEAYYARIVSVFYESLGLQYQYGQNNCLGDLGPMRAHPMHSSLLGTDNVAAGNPIGASVLVPLRNQLVSGAANDPNQLSFTADGPTVIVQVDGDPVNPIPITVEEVQVPIKMFVYGILTDAEVCRSPARAREANKLMELNAKFADMQNIIAGLRAQLSAGRQ